MPTGDDHYDAASALIKSMRGSDPDAATYWLARMLEAGEDPRFLARRIVIAAAEDVGNADPQALVVASSRCPGNRARRPARVPHSARAGGDLHRDCARNRTPRSRRSTRRWTTCGNSASFPSPCICAMLTTPAQTRLEHGKGYQYAHDAAEGWVDQDYLGVERTYYEPVDRGYEAELLKRLNELRAQRKKE